MKQAKQKTSGAAVPTMNAEAIRRALQRIAHEIIERNPELTRVVLAGIPSRGVEIAQRIAGFIHQIRKINVETGVIDVAMHRDDVGTRFELPIVRESKLPLPLEERTGSSRTDAARVEETHTVEMIRRGAGVIGVGAAAG